MSGLLFPCYFYRVQTNPEALLLTFPKISLKKIFKSCLFLLSSNDCKSYTNFKTLLFISSSKCQKVEVPLWIHVGPATNIDPTWYSPLMHTVWLLFINQFPITPNNLPPIPCSFLIFPIIIGVEPCQRLWYCQDKQYQHLSPYPHCVILCPRTVVNLLMSDLHSRTHVVNVYWVSCFLDTWLPDILLVFKKLCTTDWLN